MTDRTVSPPQGGPPPQSHLLTGRAFLAESLCGPPAGTDARTIVTVQPDSLWDDTPRPLVIHSRGTAFGILPRPFSQSIMEVAPGGGRRAGPGTRRRRKLWSRSVMEGERTVKPDGHGPFSGHRADFLSCRHRPGWTVPQSSAALAVRFHWIRKALRGRVEGLSRARGPCFVAMNDVGQSPRKIARHDGRGPNHGGFRRPRRPSPLTCNVTIVTSKGPPGGVIPFLETHVWSTGSTCSKGKGRLIASKPRLGEVGGRRPQVAACASARGPAMRAARAFSSYLLYKDVEPASEARS